MRIHTSHLVAATMLSVAVIASGRCSKRDAATNAQPQPPAAQAAPAAASQTAKRAVCAMVTAAEMSTILGTTVGAENEEGNGTTACTYKPSERSMPYVELKIDWGNGAVALASTRMLGRLEPGMTNPLAGLGDEASAVGLALMVRTGEDLVTFTMMGVDDNVGVAKRILGVMRPRMGASAQGNPRAQGPEGQGGPASDSGAAEAARAAEIVGGLLSSLAAQNERSRTSAATGAGARSNPPAASAPVDEPVFAPATDPPVRVPLIAGLTLVAAEHEPGRGDYEPIVTIAAVTSETVSTVFSANLPEGDRLQLDRAVRRDDLRQAHAYRSWYERGDPPMFAGTTAFSVSAAVLNDLKTKGQTDFARVGTESNPLMALASLVSGTGNASVRHAGTLRRVEPHAVAFPVLVNDEPALLHAIHARGTFDDATIDFHVLDDPDNPVLLRVAGGSTGRIVRITFPTPGAAPIEDKLKKEARVELHGIYFDFGKASIRPESESVLRDIASALSHNPAWKIGIEGHTDNVGGDAFNLDLSRRRAEAVKEALVARHHVPAAALTPAGFGPSRPNASNDTLSGRARNRRVELVRQ